MGSQRTPGFWGVTREEEEEEKFVKGMDFVWTLLDFSMVLSMENKSFVWFVWMVMG